MPVLLLVVCLLLVEEEGCQGIQQTVFHEDEATPDPVSGSLINHNFLLIAMVCYSVLQLVCTLVWS